jgi:hypothetical protein
MHHMSPSNWPWKWAQLICHEIIFNCTKCHNLKTSKMDDVDFSEINLKY